MEEYWDFSFGMIVIDECGGRFTLILVVGY